MHDVALLAAVRLARVCRKGYFYVPLKEAVERAKRALDSRDELRRLCQDAHDHIRELEDKGKALKK